MNQAGNVQIDMGRVVQRATAAGGQVIADLTAELGMARELIDRQQARIAELEAALAAEADPPAEPPVPGTTE